MNSQSCDLNLFPVLSESEMAMVAEIGDYREFAKGAELFSHGQKDYPFFVVVSGEIGIIDPTTGNPIPNTIHCPGGFTGD
ncbi:MAG: thioredoxin reductase, partial [bacterium]|nr:thioredoxin reductase [bacterium]